MSEEDVPPPPPPSSSSLPNRANPEPNSDHLTIDPSSSSSISATPIAIPQSTDPFDTTRQSTAIISSSSPSSSSLIPRSRVASSSTRRRRFSADDSPKPNSTYPFSADATAVALEPLDEEPSRDPRDTSAATPSSTGTKEFTSAVSFTAGSTGSGAGFAQASSSGRGGGNSGGGSGGKSGDGGIDFNGLSWPSTGTKRRLEATDEEMKTQKKRLAGAVETILECVGEDVEREGLLKTPNRYAEALMYFTKGYEQNLRDIVNGAIFNEDHDEMIIVSPIEIFSSCEHHMVPFFGKIYIGYIPNGRVLGLSKFARIADMFARRLQVQERLTKQVAAAINEVLKPQGVAVVVECTHLCMVMRGVQQTQSKTITSCMLGAFERRDRTRQEFMSLALRQ